MKFIRAALRYGIDQNSAEIALTDVEGRKKNLIFLYRIERDRLRVRLRSRLTGGAESEEIARSGAVDLDRVLPDVDATARKTDAGRRGDLWRQLDEISEVAVDRRKPAERRIRKRRPGSGFARIDHG